MLCPTMGKARIANVLSRAGLHLNTTTVGLMLKERPRWQATSTVVHSGRSIRTKDPDHIWNVDLTIVPTARNDEDGRGARPVPGHKLPSGADAASASA